MFSKVPNPTGKKKVVCSYLYFFVGVQGGGLIGVGIDCDLIRFDSFFCLETDGKCTVLYQ